MGDRKSRVRDRLRIPSHSRDDGQGQGDHHGELRQGSQTLIFRRLLDWRFDLHNHSPNGFEWGYAGSGPSQLALAICADVFRDDARAVRIYHSVKDMLIAPIKSDEGTLTESEVRDAIELAEHERIS